MKENSLSKVYKISKTVILKMKCVCATILSVKGKHYTVVVITVAEVEGFVKDLCEGFRH